MRSVYLTAAFLGLVFGTSVMAQNAAADRTIGEVTSVDAANKKFALKEDKGGVIGISFTEKTSTLRIPPGETDIKKATRIQVSEIAAGDRLLAVGAKSADGKSVDARTIVVISKADLAEKQQKDQEEWVKRGINGTVASVDPATKSFVVTMGEKKYKVDTTDKTDYHRYATDSLKYADARAGTIADLKMGDQIRVLGDKNDEALTMKAERVVSGSVQRVAGTITAINPQTGEIKLNDLMNRKPFVIQVTPKTTSRQLPPAIANMIAQRLLPKIQGGPQTQQEQGGGLAALRAQGTDVGQMLDRLPPQAIADLKPGNAIVVNGSPDGNHITAITLISGIEPIANQIPNMLRDVIGGWNLGTPGDLVDLPQ